MGSWLGGSRGTGRPEVDLRNALRGWVFAESRRGDLLGMVEGSLGGAMGRVSGKGLGDWEGNR